MMDVALLPPLIAQLRVFGSRARARLLGREDGSPWGPARWGTSATPLPSLWPQKTDGPTAMVLHYTAAATLAGTVEWFCRPELNAQASAHYVVGRLREPWHDALSADLPLVRALPTTVVECRLIEQPAYHATWTNSAMLGIEMVNLGPVAPLAPRMVGQTTAALAQEARAVSRGHPEAVKKWWQTYPPGQMQTVGELVVALGSAFNLGPARVVGHEQVQGEATPGAPGLDKQDPGPVFSWPALDAAWPLRQVLTKKNDIPDDIRIALNVLGYPTTLRPVTATFPGRSWTCSEDQDAACVQLFQRLMGLKTDGVAGPITRGSLLTRCLERQVHPG